MKNKNQKEEEEDKTIYIYIYQSKPIQLILIVDDCMNKTDTCF